MCREGVCSVTLFMESMENIMQNIFGKDWMTWIRYTITLLLIALCVGVFILASQRELTTAIQDISADRQAATFHVRGFEASALCRVGDYEWRYSTNPEMSDVKNLKLREIRVWKSGYVAMEFSDGSVSIHDSDNCVVTSTPKR